MKRAATHADNAAVSSQYVVAMIDDTMQTFFVVDNVERCFWFLFVVFYLTLFVVSTQANNGQQQQAAPTRVLLKCALGDDIRIIEVTVLVWVLWSSQNRITF